MWAHVYKDIICIIMSNSSTVDSWWWQKWRIINIDYVWTRWGVIEFHKIKRIAFWLSKFFIKIGKFLIYLYIQTKQNITYSTIYFSKHNFLKIILLCLYPSGPALQYHRTEGINVRTSKSNVVWVVFFGETMKRVFYRCIDCLLGSRDDVQAPLCIY